MSKMRRSVDPLATSVAASLAFALLVFPHAADAQIVAQAPDGSVTVQAASAPLGDLLDRLGASGSFQKLVVDPQVAARPVSVTLDRVTVRQAVVQILNAAEVNYALTADDDGRTMRLVAGEVKFVAEVQREMARETAPATGMPQLPVAEAGRAEAERPQQADATSSVEVGDALPADAGADAFQLQQLQQVLTAPVVRPPVGSVVELPFPGPDGRPLTTVVQPPGATVALPFPTATPSPTPQPNAPPVLDQQTLELLKALSPQPVQRQ